MRLLGILLLFSTVLLLTVYCSDRKKSAVLHIQGMRVSLPDSNYTKELDGRSLALAYCQACHSFPEPSLLDKKTWQEGVLPNMALRLGVPVKRENPFLDMSQEAILRVAKANVFASSPLIAQRDWDKITEYYLSEAPENPIPQQAKPAVVSGLPLFSEKPIRLSEDQTPLITLVKYDPVSATLFVANRQQMVYALNTQLQKVDSFRVNSPLSDLHVDKAGNKTLLTMGYMDPSDEYRGQLMQLPVKGDSILTMLSDIPRPVHFSAADINDDGKEDYVLSGFGNHTGRLSWYENIGNDQYQEHILKDIPGARKTIVRDFDGDGRLDIMVLMTQGNEGIWILTNRGKGNFTERAVLRFPPVYGSSYFELVDFNNDGALDILYTNGDNADYSISLKNYHGIRIFLNDGRNNYKESWFFPMHGASKALARDFDGDGDLDIAAISYFPDFTSRPQESFVYLENKGNEIFSPYTTEAAWQGRWLVMDAGDVDQDGDEDIVLGSFAFAPMAVHKELQKQWMTGPSIMILENKSSLRQSVRINNRDN